MVQRDPNSKQQGSAQQPQAGKSPSGGPGKPQQGQPERQKGANDPKRDPSEGGERGDRMPDKEFDRPGLKTGEQERNEGPATPQAGMGQRGSEAMGNQGKGQKGGERDSGSAPAKSSANDKNTGNKGFDRSK